MALPHTGSWGLPDFGITEWIQKKVAPQKASTPQGGSNLFGSSAPQVKAATTTNNTTPYGPALPPGGLPKTNTGGGGGGGGAAPTSGGGSMPSNNSANDGIDDAARRQEEAARAAAEASRQAALRRYEAQKGIAAGAKETAKGQYDWIINELGSNKKDLLDQVALNETQGIQNYTDQEAKTKQQYDTARQEILSTYRDLNLQQEKLMRGSGQAQSSRSQEASLRLNNLMGKDLTGLSTNEADSLALIGNAMTQFKEKTLNTKTSIERESKSKEDKASLDYNAQIQAIDNNMTLSENEREDAYAAAETKLAGDVANIQTWASGQKLAAQQTQAALKAQFDDYILQMTDANGLLSAGVAEKSAATQAMIKNMGFTPLQTETSLDNTSAGVYQRSGGTYKDAQSLQEALQRGEITALEYSRQLSALQRAPAMSDASMAPQLSVNQRITQQDPLLSAIFA